MAIIVEAEYRVVVYYRRHDMTICRYPGCQSTPINRRIWCPEHAVFKTQTQELVNSGDLQGVLCYLMTKNKELEDRLKVVEFRTRQLPYT